MIENIHKSVDEDQVREFIVNTKLIPPSRIVYINFGYDIGPYVREMRTLNKWE